MKYEIERKYLVRKEPWDLVEKPEGIRIKQGYLVNDHGKTIRVRIMGEQAFITIKGPSVHATRLEYEYPIPAGDAGEILGFFTAQFIDKLRYTITFAGKKWEIDEFLGNNEGLVLAEIELNNEGEEFECPAWIGEEVTDDPRYYNSSLVTHPYLAWTK